MMLPTIYYMIYYTIGSDPDYFVSYAATTASINSLKMLRM